MTIRQISNGTWIVQDALSGKLYHEPSAVPYHVIFISASDYRRMIIAKNQDRPRPIFDYAKEQFGYLPGFSFAQDTLKTPDEYACAADLVSGFEFVTEK